MREMVGKVEMQQHTQMILTRLPKVQWAGQHRYMLKKPLA
jgi:hypothetical protein